MTIAANKFPKNTYSSSPVFHKHLTFNAKIFTGMRTGFLAILRNFTHYTISQKSCNNSACTARNIFTLTDLLSLVITIPIKIRIKREAFEVELNYKIMVEC